MKGRCRICGTVGPLTWDHVPPRGAVRPEALEVSNLLTFLQPESTAASKPGFTALEFRTICGQCNGELLGKEYDPALIELSNGLALWLRAQYEQNLSLPPVASVLCRPARVARAVIGHILAAEELTRAWDPLRDAPMPNHMREYFLNPATELPHEISIFVWPYVATTQVIIRCCGITLNGVQQSAPAEVLKFFPLGFIVAWGEVGSPLSELCRLPRVFDVDHQMDLLIPLANTPAYDWPENPGNVGVLMVDRTQTFIGRPLRV